MFQSCNFSWKLIVSDQTSVSNWSLESFHCLTESLEDLIQKHSSPVWRNSVFLRLLGDEMWMSSVWVYQQSQFIVRIQRPPNVLIQTLCVCLTVGGADKGKAGDDPEEGHGDDDDDDVLKDQAAVLSLNRAGPQPIRALAGLSSSAISCLSDLRQRQRSHESPVALWLAEKSCWRLQLTEISQHMLFSSKLNFISIHRSVRMRLDEMFLYRHQKYFCQWCFFMVSNMDYCGPITVCKSAVSTELWVTKQSEFMLESPGADIWL